MRNLFVELKLLSLKGVLLGVVILLSPLFLFPKIVLVWLFLVVPLLWIVKCKKERYFIKCNIINLAILVLLIQVLISCSHINDLVFSLPKISGFLFGTFIFFCLTDLLDSKEIIRKSIIVLIGGFFFFIIISFLGMKFIKDPFLNQSYSLIERLLTPFREVTPIINFHLQGAEKGFHPNAVAGTALLVFPLIILMPFILNNYNPDYSIKSLPKRFKLYILGVFFIFITIFLLSLSMGSWLALLVISWLIFSCLKWKKRWLGIITIIVIIAIFFPAKLVTKNASEYWLLKKWEGRVKVMTAGIGAIKDHPWHGVGMNQLRRVTWIGYERSHAHNHFIHTAAELGIPALVAYLAILLGAGFMCVEVWRKGKDEFMRMSVLGLGAGQLAHFIFGLGDSIPLGAKTNFIFWVSLALITSIYNYTFRFNT